MAYFQETVGFQVGNDKFEVEAGTGAKGAFIEVTVYGENGRGVLFPSEQELQNMIDVLQRALEFTHHEFSEDERKGLCSE